MYNKVAEERARKEMIDWYQEEEVKREKALQKELRGEKVKTKLFDPFNHSAKIVEKPKGKKTKAYTEKQVRKLAREAMKDAQADSNFNVDELAQSILYFDERLQKFFQQAGIEQKLWAESFAGYFTN